MFTSRAEYRLMLREDNADLRLMEIGHGLGLIGADAANELRCRREQIAAEIQRVRGTVVRPTPKANAYLEEQGSKPIQQGVHLDQLIKRAELGYHAVEHLAPPPVPVAAAAARQVEIEIKYEGYIQKQMKEIEKFKHLEKIRIPDDFDFQTVHGLSNELKSKLTEVRPTCLGQSARIDGITPAALSVLMVALKARR
jgi:tRNA uridine 5-carboxymethylaminomethyl modification enzyme